MPGAPKMMDLGDAVLNAHRAHKDSSQSPPVHSDTQGDPSAAAGGTGGGVPEAHSLASPSSPTSPTSATSTHSFFHSTPPQSPLKKTATNTSSNTGSTPRPKHRSQASFDWFGTEGRDVSSAREQIPRGSGRTESPGGGGTGPSNAAALRFPGGVQPRGITKTASHDTPLAESPMERSEDEMEESDRGRSNGLRGAFTAEDKMRGANALRKWSGDDSTDASTTGGSKKDKSKRKMRERSASMGAVEGASTGRSRSLSLSRNTKARSVRHTSGDGDEADWEDEGRDQFAEGGPFKAGSNGGGGPSRKHSMWGGAAGFLAGRGAGDHSGTSTPDAGSDREDGGHSSGGEKGKRPMAQRRGSAWGVVRNKLGKSGKPAKKKTGESLTGHELISVSSTTSRRLLNFGIDLHPLSSRAGTHHRHSSHGPRQDVAHGSRRARRPPHPHPYELPQ